MSDYSSTYTESTGDTIDTSDFSTEFDAIETAVATKLDVDSDTATNLTIGSGYSGSVITEHSSSPFATTSGTTVDITSIPSWVKRITLILDQLSNDSSRAIWLRLGSGGSPDTTADYKFSYISINTSGNTNIGTTTSSRISIGDGYSASSSIMGKVVITNITGNSWHIDSYTGDLVDIGGAYETPQFMGNGQKSLSGTLDNIQLLLSGAGDFDAGQVTVYYEG